MRWLSLLLVCASFGLCGCYSVKGTRTPNGELVLEVHSFLHSVEGLGLRTVDQTGLSVSLDVKKAGADEALSTLSSGMVELAKIGALFAVTRTNDTATNYMINVK